MHWHFAAAAFSIELGGGQSRHTVSAASRSSRAASRASSISRSRARRPHRPEPRNGVGRRTLEICDSPFVWDCPAWLSSGGAFVAVPVEPLAPAGIPRSEPDLPHLSSPRGPAPFPVRTYGALRRPASCHSHPLPAPSRRLPCRPHARYKVRPAERRPLLPAGLLTMPPEGGAANP